MEARSQQAGASRASRTKKKMERKSAHRGLDKCANVWCTCTSHAHNGPGVFFERGYLS